MNEEKPMSYPSGPSYPQPPGSLGALDTESAVKGRKAKRDAAKRPTKRVVNRQIILAGVFAVLVALVAGALYLTSSSPGTFVVRAKADIAAMTPMTPELLEAVALPENAIEPAAYSGSSAAEALDKATAAIAAQPRAKYFIPQWAQISANDFGVELVLDEPLAPEERLMSISATVANGVAGQIRPGDTVDILGTAEKVTGLLLSNVPVVSVTVSEDLYDAAARKQASGDASGSAQTLLPADPVPGIFLVRVPADQVVRLAAVNTEGLFTLVYRGAEAKDVPPSAYNALQAVCAEDPVSEACLATQEGTTPLPAE